MLQLKCKKILKHIYAVGAGLLLLLQINSCAINPATGDADVVFMSEAQEFKIGKAEHDKIMASSAVYPDEALQAYVNEVGQKIAKLSDRPDLDYTFSIIDSPDINAFALPGGFIYINRGLLGYMQNEAQLAAVLAHEIAHVTARHTVRQDAARKGSGIGTGVLTILSVLTTGTNVGGELADLYSTAAVMGYGREMELEADQFGAQYMFRANYDPQEMINMLGTLKDYERFQRLQAADKGKKPQAYHGVFSSHPRSDQRLRSVVEAAGKLEPDTANLVNAERYRERTQGMVFGVNVEAALAAAPKPEANRYTHAKLGFTILFPENWIAENQTSAIVAQPAEKNAQLKIEVARLQANIAPSEYIRSELGVALLTKSEPFVQAGLIGHTGIKPATGESQPERIAVMYQANRVYIFTGSVTTPTPDVDYDKLFKESIATFLPARVYDTSSLKSQTLHYVRANENTTFAALAKLSPLRRYAEEELRLLNGYYPNGEPKPGAWIKIIK